MNDAALHKQRETLEIEVPPLERHNLADPQTQPPCHQHHGPVRLPDERQQSVKLIRRKDTRRFKTLRAALNPNQFHRVSVDEFPSFRTLKNRVHQTADVALGLRSKFQSFEPILNCHGLYRAQRRVSPPGPNMVIYVGLVRSFG